MVKARWIDGEFVISQITEEEEKVLPAFIIETLSNGRIALWEQVVYANTENELKEKVA